MSVWIPGTSNITCRAKVYGCVSSGPCEFFGGTANQRCKARAFPTQSPPQQGPFLSEDQTPAGYTRKAMANPPQTQGRAEKQETRIGRRIGPFKEHPSANACQCLHLLGFGLSQSLPEGETQCGGERQKTCLDSPPRTFAGSDSGTRGILACEKVMTHFSYAFLLPHRLPASATAGHHCPLTLQASFSHCPSCCFCLVSRCECPTISR